MAKSFYLHQFESSESDLNLSADSLEENSKDKIINKSCSNKSIKMENNENFIHENGSGEQKNDLRSVTNNNKSEDSNVVIPFYSQELTLAEIRRLQMSARKKIKLPNGMNNSTLNSNTNSNSNSVSDRNELYIPLDDLSMYTDSTASETRKTKKYCSSESISNTRTKARTSRSPILRNKSAIERPRGKSVSYLEQYHKKIELKNKQQKNKTESICSTRGTSTSSCRTQTSLIDLPDCYSASGRDFCTESEYNFYQDIINTNGYHSSPRNYKNNNSMLQNDLLSDKEQEIQIKIKEENKKISQLMKEKVKEKRSKSKQRKPKTPNNEFIVNPGTLGPDIQETKPKMESFLKRKEYGNTVSSKNRLDILQKRECYPLKRMEDTKSLIPVPVTNYSLTLNGEGNRSTMRMSSNNLNPMKKENKENLNNIKKKNKELIKNVEIQTNHDQKLRDTTINDDTTEMMLRRHELEKKLAESIRNQFVKK